MCGIVGGVGPSVTEHTIRKMCDALRHRGPDDLQVLRVGPAVLGIVRLSIVDVEGGKQPFLSADGTKVLIGNGEIYNYRELRTKLVTEGATFRSFSDIEVALHLFEALGPDSFTRLNGMFALAIYDGAKNELWLARDRFGQKPLYLWEHGVDYFFSSEAKAFLVHEQFTGEVDLQSLNDYFAFRYVPAPKSIWRGVRKLSPGTWACLASGQWRSKRYFRITYDRRERCKRKSAADHL